MKNGVGFSNRIREREERIDEGGSRNDRGDALYVGIYIEGSDD